MTPRDLTKILAPLRGRIQMMIARAVVSLVDDSLKMQGLQLTILAGETKGNVERFQQYGFTSHPFPGAEALVLFLGGNRDHGIVVAVDDRRYRLKSMAPGEVALFDDLGQRVSILRDKIEINTTLKVDVVAPQVNVISDDVNLGGAGGPAVARVGDLVNVSGGSSSGQWPIVSGSTKVKST